MSAAAEAGKLPVREYGLRERYRGAMLEYPSGQPAPRSWAAGYQAGVRVAMACAAEALASNRQDVPFDDDSWARRRAMLCALDPVRLPDLRPQDRTAALEGPDRPT